MPGALDLLLRSLEKPRKDDQHINAIYIKAMDFYKRGLYYETDGRLRVAGRYYIKALRLINVNVSRKNYLTRLVVGGYEQWLTGLSTFKKIQ